MSTTWSVDDTPPEYESYPHPKHPNVRVEVARCNAETPSWGWEGEGVQCIRPPHENDPWHYYREDALIIWWKDDRP